MLRSRFTLSLFALAVSSVFLAAQESDTPFGQKIRGDMFAPNPATTATTTTTTLIDIANSQWQSAWQNKEGLRSIYFFAKDGTYTETGANSQSGNWTLTSGANLAFLVLTSGNSTAAKSFEISPDGKTITQDNGLRWTRLGAEIPVAPATVTATAPGVTVTASVPGKFEFFGTQWSPIAGSGANTEIEFRDNPLAFFSAKGGEFVAWKELSDGLVEISHANGERAIYLLGPDRKTLSKTASAEQWVHSNPKPAATLFGNTNPTAPTTPEAETPTSPFIEELNQLLSQYKNAMADASRMQNNRDKSALESMQRRASQNGDVEIALKVHSALEAVAKSETFDFPTEYNTPERIRRARASIDSRVRAEIELIDVKEQRDRAMTGITKTVNQRFKLPFEALLRRAMQAGDMTSAQRIKMEQDFYSTETDLMAKSEFYGKRWTWLAYTTSMGVVRFMENGRCDAPSTLNLRRWDITSDGKLRVYRNDGTYYIFKLNATKTEAGSVAEVGAIQDTTKVLRPAK